MDNPNRINPTALTPTVPRQTPDNDFGKVLTRTVANGVSLGVKLAAPLVGPSIVSAAGNLLSQVSQQAAQGAQPAVTNLTTSSLSPGARKVGGAAGGSGGGGGSVGAPGGAGGAAEAGSDQWDMLEAQRLMNSENQRFNLAYLGLQDAMQKESREFNAISNIMKVRHDSAKAAINNIR